MSRRSSKPTIVLASASPRRRELMKRLGYPFRVMRPRVDERRVPSLRPSDLCVHLACLKARDVARRKKLAIVVAADTLVVCRNKLIGKPRDAEDAFRVLKELSGTRHSVITGVCVLDAQRNKEYSGYEETRIRMRKPSEGDIRKYVVSGEGMGKAGGYAVQETGDRFVQSYCGSFSNIVGLPVELVGKLLRKAISGRQRKAVRRRRP